MSVCVVVMVVVLGGGGASLWSGNLVSPCCLFLLRHRSLGGNTSISVLTGLSADSSLDASSPYSSWQPITALHSLHFLPLAEDVKKEQGTSCASTGQ